MGLNKILSGVLLGTALTLGTASVTDAKTLPLETEMQPSSKKEVADEEMIDINLQFGFGYVMAGIAPALQDIVQETKETFVGTDGKDTLVSFDNGSDFRDWFSLGRQNAYLSLSAEVIIKRPIFGNFGYLLLNGELDYGNSKIFGSRRISESFEGKVIGVNLGETPTYFTQELDHFFRAMVGGKILLQAYQSRNFDVGFLSGLDLGLIYLQGNSELNLHVNGNDKTELVGWDQLNEIGVFQNIVTKDIYEGVGLVVHSEIGVRTRLWGVTVDLAYSPNFTWIPVFKLSEIKKSDFDRPNGRIENRCRTLDYQVWDHEIIVRMGYQF